MSVARAIGLLLGMAADGVFGDPQRGHPVAAFGAMAKRAERVLYRDGKASGVVHTAVVGGGAVLVGALVERLGRRGPVTERIQKEFFDYIGGEIPDRYGWFTPVYAERAATATKPALVAR